jgi:hypothetical protein
MTTSRLVIDGSFKDQEIQAKDTKTLDVFTRKGESAYYMRVKPTHYLLNSTLICDSINKNKPLIVNLTNGSCYFLNDSEMVTLVTKARMVVEE